MGVKSNIAADLEKLIPLDDVVHECYELTDQWTKEKIGIEAVEPILQFIEKYPDKDYGAPGPLVHFMETFHRNGYVERLIVSLQRKPTLVTVQLLVRLVNGTENANEHATLLKLMKKVRNNAQLDATTVAMLDNYLRKY